jgi:dihydroorotase-like cyclic amidohydrolase
MPGLETTLPLLLTAAHGGKLDMPDIIQKCFTKPKEIFHIPEQQDTHIEIDESEEWIIDNEKLFTKSKWSPFHGWPVKGKIKQVILRGEKVYEDGNILKSPGTGRVL